MKKWLKILFLLTIVSVIAHDLVPHSHHSTNSATNICFTFSADTHSTDVADNCTHNHASSACCFLVYLSAPVHNYVSDFQLMSDHSMNLVFLMVLLFSCLCSIYKVRLKAIFIYFLNYKSPFVGLINTLRAPPVFSIA